MCNRFQLDRETFFNVMSLNIVLYSNVLKTVEIEIKQWLKRNEEKWFYWSVMNYFICNQCIVISFQASNYIWPKSNSEATVTTISTRVKGLKSTMRSFRGLRILWKISIYKSLLKNEYENLTYFKWIIETIFNAIYVANIF